MFTKPVVQRCATLLTASMLATIGGSSYGAECVRCSDASYKVEYTYQYAVDRPGQPIQGSAGGSPICAGDNGRFGGGEHTIQILFSDVRENEYTVELSLLDDFGAVHDHAVVLVMADGSAEFRLLARDTKIVGNIKVTMATDPAPEQ